MVKTTPAATDSPAEPMVWTMLFSRIVLFPSFLNTAMERTAIGIEAETVRPARGNWEEKCAKGGVGAIISTHTPISVAGRHLPGYAILDRDERVPFFRTLGEVVHRHDCKFILQLNHCGRQQDVGGIENLGTL